MKDCICGVSVETIAGMRTLVLRRGLYGMAWRRGFWVRRGLFSLGLTDHRQIPPLFTERYERRPARYLHLGPWCLWVEHPSFTVKGAARG